jgi:putative oxidoreductase
MRILQVFVIYLGRFFLSSIFLISSINEMLDWGETEKFVQMSMVRWVDTFQASDGVFMFLSALLPWLPWFLLLGIVFKLVGSFLLIIGCNVRLGATLLIAFLVPVTWIVHGFWHIPEQNQPIEMVMFLKNISILGGLLVVLAFGKGNASSRSD